MLYRRHTTVTTNNKWAKPCGKYIVTHVHFLHFIKKYICQITELPCYFFQKIIGMFPAFGTFIAVKFSLIFSRLPYKNGFIDSKYEIFILNLKKTILKKWFSPLIKRNFMKNKTKIQVNIGIDIYREQSCIYGFIKPKILHYRQDLIYQSNEISASINNNDKR